MIYLDEAAVYTLLKPADLIRSLRDAFVSNIQSPQRTHHQIPGSDAARMLLMPSWQLGGGIGVKVLTLDPERSKLGVPSIEGLYVLMDGVTGIPQAVIAARALTAARTAAVSALAASYLVRPNASTLLMVGTGNLAPHIIKAHCAVRPYNQILIWGRDTEKAKALRDGLLTNIEVIVATSLEEAIAQADVISCATTSTTPLVNRRAVRDGTHIDLIGSYTPQMREADSNLFQGARVFVDTRDAVFESGDLIAPCSEGFLAEASIRTLADLIGDPALGRSDNDELTIFKAAGTAIADFAAAQYLLAQYKSSLGS